MHFIEAPTDEIYGIEGYGDFGSNKVNLHSVAQYLLVKIQYLGPEG